MQVKTKSLIKKTGTSSSVDASRRIKTISMDRTIRTHLIQTRQSLSRLEQFAKNFSEKIKELEEQDKLGNFEIQDLMSQYSKANSLVSSILKKKDDVTNAIISKI